MNLSKKVSSGVNAAGVQDRSVRAILKGKHLSVQSVSGLVHTENPSATWNVIVDDALVAGLARDQSRHVLSGPSFIHDVRPTGRASNDEPQRQVSSLPVPGHLARGAFCNGLCLVTGNVRIVVPTEHAGVFTIHELRDVVLARGNVGTAELVVSVQNAAMCGVSAVCSAVCVSSPTQQTFQPARPACVTVVDPDGSADRLCYAMDDMSRPTALLAVDCQPLDAGDVPAPPEIAGYDLSRAVGDKGTGFPIVVSGCWVLGVDNEPPFVISPLTQMGASLLLPGSSLVPGPEFVSIPTKASPRYWACPRGSTSSCHSLVMEDALSPLCLRADRRGGTLARPQHPSCYAALCARAQTSGLGDPIPPLLSHMRPSSSESGGVCFVPVDGFKPHVGSNPFSPGFHRFPAIVDDREVGAKAKVHNVLLSTVCDSGWLGVSMKVDGVRVGVAFDRSGGGFSVFTKTSFLGHSSEGFTACTSRVSVPTLLASLGLASGTAPRELAGLVLYFEIVPLGGGASSVADSLGPVGMAAVSYLAAHATRVVTAYPGVTPTAINLARQIAASTPAESYLLGAGGYSCVLLSVSGVPSVLFSGANQLIAVLSPLVRLPPARGFTPAEFQAMLANPGEHAEGFVVHARVGDDLVTCKLKDPFYALLTSTGGRSAITADECATLARVTPCTAWRTPRHAAAIGAAREVYAAAILEVGPRAKRKLHTLDAFTEEAFLTLLSATLIRMYNEPALLLHAPGPDLTGFPRIDQVDEIQVDLGGGYMEATHPYHPASSFDVGPMVKVVDLDGDVFGAWAQGAAVGGADWPSQASSAGEARNRDLQPLLLGQAGAPPRALVNVPHPHGADDAFGVFTFGKLVWLWQHPWTTSKVDRRSLFVISEDHRAAQPVLFYPNDQGNGLPFDVSPAFCDALRASDRQLGDDWICFVAHGNYSVARPHAHYVGLNPLNFRERLSSLLSHDVTLAPLIRSRRFVLVPSRRSYPEFDRAVTQHAEQLLDRVITANGGLPGDGFTGRQFAMPPFSLLSADASIRPAPFFSSGSADAKHSVQGDVGDLIAAPFPPQAACVPHVTMGMECTIRAKAEFVRSELTVASVFKAVYDPLRHAYAEPARTSFQVIEVGDPSCVRGPGLALCLDQYLGRMYVTPGPALSSESRQLRKRQVSGRSGDPYRFYPTRDTNTGHIASACHHVVSALIDDGPLNHSRTGRPVVIVWGAPLIAIALRNSVPAVRVVSACVLLRGHGYPDDHEAVSVDGIDILISAPDGPDPPTLFPRCAPGFTNTLSGPVLADAVVAKHSSYGAVPDRGWAYGSAGFSATAYPGWLYNWHSTVCPSPLHASVFYAKHQRLTPWKPSVPDGIIAAITSAAAGVDGWAAAVDKWTAFEGERGPLQQAAAAVRSTLLAVVRSRVTLATDGRVTLPVLRVVRWAPPGRLAVTRPSLALYYDPTTSVARLVAVRPGDSIAQPDALWDVKQTRKAVNHSLTNRMSQLVVEATAGRLATLSAFARGEEPAQVPAGQVAAAAAAAARPPLPPGGVPPPAAAAAAAAGPPRGRDPLEDGFPVDDAERVSPSTIPRDITQPPGTAANPVMSRVPASRLRVAPGTYVLYQGTHAECYAIVQ